MTRPFAAVLFLLTLLVVGGTLPVAAQQRDDSARAKAERDFHGSDGTGKDGPLSAAGMDMLILYHRYQAAASRDDFTPEQSGIRVSEGHVTVDAIAREKAEQLRSDLEQLGMEKTAVAGRVVSGRLPIDKIPEAAQLESLRALLPSRARTREHPSPSTLIDPPSSPSSDTASEDGNGTGDTSGCSLLLVAGGLVLLVIEEL